MWIYSYSDHVSLDELCRREVSDPIPGSHDVVLKMRAASLNYRDLAIARGHYHVAVNPPLIPLSDGAGEVAAVGSNVTRVCIGDLACPVFLPNWIDGPISERAGKRRLGGPDDGVLAEYLCLNEEEVVRMPDYLDAVEAATLPVASVTAWHSIYELGTLRPGETIVVLGSGGVSTAAIQLAHAGGARVIVVTRRDEFKARLVELGADEVITGSDSDAWPQMTNTLTHGAGADVVVDVLGGPSLARSIAALGRRGVVHLVGYAADTSATFDIFDAIRHGTTIHVATAGSRTNFESLLRAFGQKMIRPAVAKTFPVAKIKETFEELSKGGHLGKIVLTF
jgi:NADPH:quinone reductase-like Zn-dependent oxidoreductase